ncbi:armadillo-type protein [Hyaloraphidium curvatum]|nr:armadillo-type protein [Hyaloraphidium curvatum]
MAPREPAPQTDLAVEETAAQLGLASLTPKDAIAADKGASAKQLFDRATAAAAAADRAAAAAELVGLVAAAGPHALDAFDVFASLRAALADKKNAVAREGALGLVAAVAASPELRAAEPFLIPLLRTVLDLLADKAKPVTAAAAKAAEAIAAGVNSSATKMVLPILYQSMDYSQKWQVKEGALRILGQLASVAPKQMTAAVPDIIPLVSDCMWDTKAEVKKAAFKAMNDVCALISNKDIEKFIPALIACIAEPEKVPETVHQLGATTFVQEVESPTLAIMVPLLSRGMQERSTPIRRKCAVIIDNMCKLVENPAYIAPFLPKLLPALRKVEDEMSDPEARSVAERARVMLEKFDTPENRAILTEAEKLAESLKTEVRADEKHLHALSHIVKDVTGSELPQGNHFFRPSVEYVAILAANLEAAKDFDPVAWEAAVVPYLLPLLPEDQAKRVADAFLDKCYKSLEAKEDNGDEEDEGEEDLCDCEFSLAYGARILLNRTKLHLKRGRRYGLCGANGTGKSTLMRAIANEQVEGFPPKEVLRTVYVEHDIDGSLADIPVLEFVMLDETIGKQNKDDVVTALKGVGFDDAKLKTAIASLSGGWKMKLALARAMLLNADILLLDEPTNHLDVVNVAWLENYLTGLKTVTSIIVSHDSGFLDNVCTDIIHIHNFKLKRYRGNLSEFVKRVPEAKSYYELGAAEIKFKFPEPGFLEGVKTKERAIIKMQKVDFQYPGTDRKQLEDISFQCSLGSRVAIIGPNGAGKSTLVKLLVGELEANEGTGTVWRHPNLRIAYVAQHAFHHIEHHLDKTPNQYIQWRYATGEDREELGKANRTISAEEEKEMSKVHVIDGMKLVVDEVLARRKLKSSYEYEVSFVGKMSSDNMWLPRSQLEEMGLLKKLQEVDMKEAASQGLARPLVQKEIEKHLVDMGLEPEIISHSHIKGMSGGQKVKLVIGAAMWQRPHILVLDEPTNYLDRESLGALAHAIKEFGGGVCIITHNREFTEALCTEVWAVDAGRLTPSGHNWVQGQGKGPRLEEKDQEDTLDAMGNVVKGKAKSLSAKDAKKKARAKALKKKNGVRGDRTWRSRGSR